MPPFVSQTIVVSLADILSPVTQRKRPPAAQSRADGPNQPRPYKEAPADQPPAAAAETTNRLTAALLVTRTSSLQSNFATSTRPSSRT